jgi:hypothetical protein
LAPKLPEISEAVSRNGDELSGKFLNEEREEKMFGWNLNFLQKI